MKRQSATVSFDDEVGELLPRASLLRAELVESLRRYEALAVDNPMENPVQRLAYDLSRRYEQGELSFKDFDQLIQLLTVNTFLYRARRLRNYVGECDIAANTESFQALIEGIAAPGGEPLDFADFKARVEQEIFGIVITAHPTFGISEELTITLARLATGRGESGEPLTEKERAALLKHAVTEHHGRHRRLDLNSELDFSEETILRIQGALRRVYVIVLEVAQRHYPSRWTEITPRLMTVASWVGYDLDGRSDIKWFHTLLARMKGEARQLDVYEASAREGAAELTAAGDADAAAGMDRIADRLRDARAEVAEDIAILAGSNGEIEPVKLFSQRLARARESRLLSAVELLDLLTKALDAAKSDAAKRRLFILRAELANYGLSISHIHMRMNATQVNNAVRKQLDLESAPDDPGNRRRYLRSVNKLLEQVKPQTVNFGSIMDETTSAKRIFMLIAQIFKYVDNRTPIRFLIAECDNAFTVLAALYMARLFGVEDKVDISPLFETPAALQHGHALIADLLKNKHYVDYVTRRGRLCIQTGFSDAGRYIGQVAASLAIERIRIKLADIIKETGLKGVDLVIYDTHGESIGRGAHPVSFSDRLDYTYPPASRHLFACNDIPVKQEVSFQGGDGYAFFATPELAFATVCRLLEHALNSPRDACDIAAHARNDDLFYTDTDYSLEFFITVKNYNQSLMEDPNYAALLSAFGANLLFPTGSRNVKRQHDGKGAVDTTHPNQIRAIPHNAILQQMGYLANSICGVGKAIMADRDHFAEVYKHSERCQEIIALANYAFHLSSLNSLGAYVDLFDPVSWLKMAAFEKNEVRSDRMQRISRLLRETRRHERLYRMYRVFLQDSISFREGLSQVGGAEDLVPPVVDECHPDLELLHAVRISLIHELFLLISVVPRFSSNSATTIDEVVAELLKLDVERAVGNLKGAFPRSGKGQDPKAFGEDASYRTEVDLGYDQENDEIFDPMEELYDLVRRISVGVSHIMGAVG